MIYPKYVLPCEGTCSYTVFPDTPPSLLCLTARAAPHSPPGPGSTRRPRDRQPVTTTDPPLTRQQTYLA